LWPLPTIASFTHPHPREALIRQPPAVCSSPAFLDVDVLYVLNNGQFLPVAAAIHAYDAAGDITANVQRFSQNAADELTQILEKATPDAPAWTTNARFSDRNGNLTNAAGMTLRYDSENRLTNVVSGSTTATATYDGQGNRIKLVAVTAGQTNVTWFVLDYADPLRRPLAELNAAGNPVRYFVWGRGLVAQVETNGTIRYFHADSQGSTLALTDNAGTQTDAWFYSPYGQTLNRTGSTDTSFQWLGAHGVRCEGGGIYLTRYRAYHAGLMRFTSSDPLGIAGGANLFVYANGNPLLLIDPWGLCAELSQWHWYDDVISYGWQTGRNAADYVTAPFRQVYNAADTYYANPTVENAAYLAQAYLPVVIGAGLSALAPAVEASTPATVANPVPSTVARVVPGSTVPSTLGRAGASDVFVTAADDIVGMNAAQIQQRLSISPSPTYTVIEFPTPSSGLASPVNRLDPGFVGGGVTGGGAREFVLPNGPVPANATWRVVP